MCDGLPRRNLIGAERRWLGFLEIIGTESLVESGRAAPGARFRARAPPSWRRWSVSAPRAPHRCEAPKARIRGLGGRARRLPARGADAPAAAPFAAPARPAAPPARRPSGARRRGVSLGVSCRERRPRAQRRCGAYVRIRRRCGVCENAEKSTPKVSISHSPANAQCLSIYIGFLVNYDTSACSLCVYLASCTFLFSKTSLCARDKSAHSTLSKTSLARGAPAPSFFPFRGARRPERCCFHLANKPKPPWPWPRRRAGPTWAPSTRAPPRAASSSLAARARPSPAARCASPHTPRRRARPGGMRTPRG